MARQTGIIQLEGKLGNVVFYKSKGTYYARELKPKKRGKKMEECAELPKYKHEFLATHMIGKPFRDCAREHITGREVGLVGGKATKLCYEMMNQEAETKEKRDILVSKNKDLLSDFNFHVNKHLYDVCCFPSGMKVGKERKFIEVNIPAFDPGVFMGPPRGATHCELKMGLLLLSDVVYNKVTGKYELTDALHHGKRYLKTLGLLPLEGGENEGFEFVLWAGQPGESTTGVVVLSVRFVQRVNGRDYALAQGNCMGIFEVF